GPTAPYPLSLHDALPIYQQHRPRIGCESVPQLAALDVVSDVFDPLVAELAVAQPRYCVVFVESLQRLGGRLDMPFDQGRAQAFRSEEHTSELQSRFDLVC